MCYHALLSTAKRELQGLMITRHRLSHLHHNSQPLNWHFKDYLQWFVEEEGAAQVGSAFSKGNM